MRAAWIVGVFAALVVLLGVGLKLDPREVPSPLIGKRAPDFRLPVLGEPGKTLSRRDMQGRVWILNVWASWCVPCREEHPVVAALARSGIAPVIGFNYKDAADDALPWLKENGNPYQEVVFDRDGRVGIDYGVYGVPETYVIDRTGVIRYKHIGPLTPQIVQSEIAPLVKALSSRG